MEKFYIVIAGVAVFIGLLLLSGLGISSTRPMPDNAMVYVNDVNKTYLAPTCIKTAIDLRLTTAGEAVALGYKSDKECRETGAFVQDGRTLTGTFFQIIGIFKPMPSRWNEDGSWNY